MCASIPARSFGCRLALALTCKALGRACREQQAEWWQGLHLHLAPITAPEVAACQRQVRRLLALQQQQEQKRQQQQQQQEERQRQQQEQQRQQPEQAIVTRLTVKLSCLPESALDLLLAMIDSLRKGLLAVAVDVGAIAFAAPGIEFPQAVSAKLRGGRSSSSSLTSRLTFTTALQSLEMDSCLLNQLPPCLTHLSLWHVDVKGQAGPAIFAGKPRRVAFAPVHHPVVLF